MKKILIAALLCAMASKSNAQTLTSVVTNAGADNDNIHLGNPNAANTTGETRAGIWLDNDGILKFRNVTGYGYSFRNASSNSDLMVINANGNVGIGTGTPGAALSVYNTAPTLQIFDTQGNRLDGSSMGKLAFGSFYGEFASIEASRIPGNADDLSKIIFRTSFSAGVGGDGNNKERMRIDYNGNVGIGTTTPAANLEVNTNAIIGTNGNKFNSALTLIKNGDTYGIDNPVLILKHSGNGVNSYSNPATDLGVLQIKGFATTWANKAINSNDNFYVFTNGTVGVNTDHVPVGFNMAVNGSVIATAVTVKLYSAWPDYVFKPNYNLKPLAEVKTYIDQNHHLPDMPSEKEVADKGIDLGEMNKLLTKKVEELTLYMIQKDKENTELKQMLKDLGTRLQQVEAKIQKDK